MNKNIIMLIVITNLSCMNNINNIEIQNNQTEQIISMEKNTMIFNYENKDIQSEPVLETNVIQNNQMSYIENIVSTASHESILPKQLIMAVIEAESNFDPNAVGPDTDFGNAYGLMQLLPSTAQEVGVLNIYDPEDNIKGGTKYFKKMIIRYSDKEYYDQNGNLLTPYEMGVMAYNWGYPNLDKHMNKNSGKVVISENSKYAIPKETYNYLVKIRTNYDFNEYHN